MVERLVLEQPAPYGAQRLDKGFEKGRVAASLPGEAVVLGRVAERVEELALGADADARSQRRVEGPGDAVPRLDGQAIPSLYQFERAKDMSLLKGRLRMVRRGMIITKIAYTILCSICINDIIDS